MNRQRKEYTSVNVLSDEYIYYDLTLANTNRPGDEQKAFEAARFSETKTVPLIRNNKDDYKFAIVRLNLPSTSIPLFEHYENYFYVELEDPNSGETSGPIEVLYNTVSTMNPPTDYSARNVYYISQFLEAVNTAYLTAYNTLVANYNTTFGVGAWAASGRAVFQPYITYENRLFTLHYDNRGAEGATNPTNIWMNYNLFYKFYGLPSIINSFSAASKRDVRLRVFDRVRNNTVFTTPARTELDMTSDSSSTNLWYELYKIVVISNQLSLRAEFVTTHDFNASINPNSGGDNVRINAVTDFGIELGVDLNNYSRITYFPPGDPRWIDITGGQDEVKEIDFEIKLLTKDLVLLPLYLQPNESVNLKGVFTKKN